MDQVRGWRDGFVVFVLASRRAIDTHDGTEGVLDTMAMHFFLLPTVVALLSLQWLCLFFCTEYVGSEPWAVPGSPVNEREPGAHCRYFELS